MRKDTVANLDLLYRNKAIAGEDECVGREAFRRRHQKVEVPLRYDALGVHGRHVLYIVAGSRVVVLMGLDGGAPVVDCHEIHL